MRHTHTQCLCESQSVAPPQRKTATMVQDRRPPGAGRTGSAAQRCPLVCGGALCRGCVLTARSLSSCSSLRSLGPCWRPAPTTSPSGNLTPSFASASRISPWSCDHSGPRQRADDDGDRVQSETGINPSRLKMTSRDAAAALRLAWC